MNEESWYKLEFKCLRQELKDRVIFLHKTINLAIIALMVLTIITFILIALKINRDLIHTFVLLIPIILFMIGFNYQSNQNSLESIPKYFEETMRPMLKEKYGEKILGWEKFFAQQKEPFKIESVTKVLPFLSAAVIPFYFIFAEVTLAQYQWVLVVVNIFLFIVFLENFRYKLRRVK